MNPNGGPPIHTAPGYREETSGGSQSGHDSRPTVVGLHFRVGKKIGEGSFGIIHEGKLDFLTFCFGICLFSQPGFKQLVHRWACSCV